MKFEVAKNRTAVDDIRKGISDPTSLQDFDKFMAKYPTIDISDSNQMDAAAASCPNCCHNVTVSTTVNVS